VAALLATAPGASAATNCPDADATPASVGPARSAIAVACLVNHERQAVGLARLRTSAQPAQAGQWHVDDMSARGYFAHDAPAPAPHGTNVGHRLTGTGYSWSIVGENIARGQTTPRQVMRDWLASAGHCRNIMDPSFTEAGYAITTAGNGPYWAQIFARPMSVPQPSGPAIACPAVPASPAPTGTPGAELPTPPDDLPDAPGTGAAIDPGDDTTGTPVALPAGTGTGATDGASAGTTTTTSTRVRASAARTARRLRLRVTLPAGTGRTTMGIRVLQRGRTVSTVRTSRAAGRTHRWRITLPSARAGRVVVTVAGRSVSARFR
jgi:uncharacterized protein YkwD